jgi:hypothetical protein
VTKEADDATIAWANYQLACAAWAPKDERQAFYRLARDAEDRLARAQAYEKALAARKATA